MVMDYEGRILGVAGATGEKTQSRAFNRATMAKRQTGSSIKPLSVYSPGIELDKITYSTVYDDTPPFKLRGEPWPNNYSGTYTDQPTTIANGLERSLNTIAAGVVKDLGYNTCFDFAKERYHLENLIDEPEDETEKSDRDVGSMALGGVNGLTLREMTAAFAAFGNGGLYYEPYSYYKVEDNDGNVLLENAPTPDRAISSDTAWVMNRMMTQVIDGSQGTARSARFRSGMELFAKTGTAGNDTLGSTDAWLIGGSPYYVTGSWYGFDKMKDIGSAVTTGAVAGWKMVMSLIHKHLDNAKFDADPNVVTRTYCADSGLLAGAGCSHTGTGYYKKSNIPTTCDGRHGGGGEDETPPPDDTSSSSSSSSSSSRISSTSSTGCSR